MGIDIPTNSSIIYYQDLIEYACGVYMCDDGFRFSEFPILEDKYTDDVFYGYLEENASQSVQETIGEEIYNLIVAEVSRMCRFLESHSVPVLGRPIDGRTSKFGPSDGCNEQRVK